MRRHSGGKAGHWSRTVAPALRSLLLGGAAILGAILVFRQGLLPLIDAAFHPDPGWLSAFRRAGILLSALGGYWAHVHWHEGRKAAELRLRPLPLLLGGLGGAALAALPIAALFGLGAYQLVLVRGLAPGLLGAAVLILIAATLEELVHRCLLFGVLERAWGTGVALVLQAVLFALPHLENLKQGGARDVAAMLVSVSLLGLLWGTLYALTRNLWVVVAHHAAWNFTILLSGLPLSGNEDWRALAPLHSRYAGPDGLTGGLFGPESSLLLIAVVLAAVALLLRALYRRGAGPVPAESSPDRA
ncbi:MAG: CPBP family intramembrane glutamic endopeptidase [Holophagaceae bacterium]